MMSRNQVGNIIIIKQYRLFLEVGQANIGNCNEFCIGPDSGLLIAPVSSTVIAFEDYF